MNRFVFVVLCSGTAATVAAQLPAPSFEIASIKPSTSATLSGGSRVSRQSFGVNAGREPILDSRRRL